MEKVIKERAMILEPFTLTVLIILFIIILISFFLSLINTEHNKPYDWRDEYDEKSYDDEKSYGINCIKPTELEEENNAKEMDEWKKLLKQ
jgi:hypothetical protein